MDPCVRLDSHLLIYDISSYLQPDENEEDDELELKFEDEQPPHPLGSPWQGPPILPFRGMLHRIGFAGRGMGRGHPGQGRGGASG